MSILKGQLNVASTRGMPVDEKKTSGSVSSTSTETVQLYYNNAGTLTADAGQAAGVVVVGKLSYNNVKNVLGDAQGRKGDTSLSFTSTALTSEVGVETITPTFIEGLDDMIWSQRLTAIGAKLSNGQYVVDYARGVIYGKKTSTGATLTSTTYKYGAAASSGGGVSATDGSAFTAGTDPVTPIGFLADETSTGSVDEGDIGAARMTLDRKQINASEFLEDTADVAAGYLTKIGLVRRDTAASSSGTDGDVSTMNTDALGHVWNREGYAPDYEDNAIDRAKVLQWANYTNISASALIKTGSGYLAGFIVNSCAATATLKLWDQTSAAVPVLCNTMTFTLAETQGPAPTMFPSPILFNNGLYATIAVAAMDVTLIWI